MLCQEIMKPNVECLLPTDTVQSAARKMRDANLGFLPVCDESRRVLGTLTDRDIAIRIAAENRPFTTPVRDAMTREVVACQPTDDIRRAEQLMGQHHKSRILCTDANNRIAGVISLSDIAQREEGGRAVQTFRQVTEREAHV